jgi:hypothetical protein
LLKCDRELGAEVEHVTIGDLQRHFLRQITLKVNGREMQIDSRPSDAIALAVRSKVPVYVVDEVMEQAAITPEQDLETSMPSAASQEHPGEEPPEAFKEFLEGLDLSVGGLFDGYRAVDLCPACLMGRACIWRCFADRLRQSTYGQARQDDPGNTEAEEAVLGSLLIDPDAVIKVSSFLRADDFYRERNAWIYQSVLGLHERRDPADFLTVVDDLERQDRLRRSGRYLHPSLINNVWRRLRRALRASSALPPYAVSSELPARSLRWRKRTPKTWMTS